MANTPPFQGGDLPVRVRSPASRKNLSELRGGASPCGFRVAAKKSPMKDLIILAGAPGSGKSTIGELLREKQGFPLIDFGWLRQGHLDDRWSNATPEEEQMAFENLVFY